VRYGVVVETLCFAVDICTFQLAADVGFFEGRR